MENKGLLSIEAAAALAVLVAIAISIPHTDHYNPKDIFLVEKMDDLLIVWARGDEDTDEMVADAQLVLGKGNFEIEKGVWNFGNIPGSKISREIAVRSGGTVQIIRISASE